MLIKIYSQVFINERASERFPREHDKRSNKISLSYYNPTTIDIHIYLTSVRNVFQERGHLIMFVEYKVNYKC